MSSTFQLRPNETILFQGDVANLQSLLNIKEGHGVVTDQRCVFQWSGQTFSAERPDLADVQEEKHGLGTKLVARHCDGNSVTVQAPNMRGLTAALLTLVGRQPAEAALRQPERSAVKNGMAWLAAFSPLLSGFIVMFIFAIMGWNPNASLSLLALAKLVIFRLVLIYLFMRIDHVSLQRQGFDTVSLGIIGPEKFWAYLGSRAKAFGHGKGYAITWWVLFLLDLAFLLFAE